MTLEQLWTQLGAGGLVEGALPDAAHHASPWYVRVMLGIAGWIGAWFLLFFVAVGLSFVIENAVASAVTGAACCGAAWALFRKFDTNDFAEQFALVISLVGQGLLIFAIAQFIRPGKPGFFLAVAALEAVLAFVVPNFLHRVLTTGGAAIALALAINQLSLRGLAIPLLCLGFVLVWIDPKRWAASGRVWRPIGYGLVLALLLIELFKLLGGEKLLGLMSGPPNWFALHGPLLGRALTAGLLLWVAFALARREGLAPTSRIGLAVAAAAIILGLLSLNAPGLASALLILLLGFSTGNRLLAALGILSLLGFMTHFYYSLHATLLEKSGLLAVTGLCLLAAYVVLRRVPQSAAATEAGHA